jgi:hypothetical protein
MTRECSTETVFGEVIIKTNISYDASETPLSPVNMLSLYCHLYMPIYRYLFHRAFAKTVRQLMLKVETYVCDFDELLSHPLFYLYDGYP